MLSATYGCSPFYVTCKKINTKNAKLCNAFDSQLAMHNINKYSSEECDKVFSRTLKYDQSPSTLSESYTHAFKIVDDFVKHFHIVCLWILNGIDFSECLRMRLCVCLHFHLNVATNMLNYSCIWLTIGKIEIRYRYTASVHSPNIIRTRIVHNPECVWLLMLLLLLTVSQ